MSYCFKITSLAEICISSGWGLCPKTPSLRRTPAKNPYWEILATSLPWKEFLTRKGLKPLNILTRKGPSPTHFFYDWLAGWIHIFFRLTDYVSQLLNVLNFRCNYVNAVYQTLTKNGSFDFYVRRMQWD